MKCNLKEQIKIGTKIEMEHASLFPKDQQKKMAEKIARQHLEESPCYYRELKKMERRFK